MAKMYYEKDCDLGKLSSIRSRSNCDISHYENSVLTVFRGLGDKEHCTADARDARSAFDNLEGRAESVTGCGKGTADLAVGIAALDNEAAEV